MGLSNALMDSTHSLIAHPSRESFGIASIEFQYGADDVPFIVERKGIKFRVGNIQWG